MPVYLKQVWVNGPGGNTPLSAERLQHIEDGIAAVETALSSTVTQEQTRAEAAEQQSMQAVDAETTRAMAAEALTLSLAQTYADTKVSTLVGSAGQALDTLGEIDAQIAADEGSAAALAATVATKAATTAVDAKDAATLVTATGRAAALALILGG